MPLGFDPQRPPGMFPWLDFLESRVPGAAYYALGGVGAVTGYFSGLGQDYVPLPFCVALGLLIGLLSVPLTLKILTFLICAALVGFAAVGTFLMMNTDTAQKHTAPSAVHASPSKTGRKLLDQLFQGVR